jgi:hypothetical protein
VSMIAPSGASPSRPSWRSSPPSRPRGSGSRELAELDALDTANAFATATARRALQSHAAKIRAALLAHPAEVSDSPTH